ncbi:deoxyribonuclease-2-alpha [Neoarius graeffei]|uniref:deoxyribonuclease-2-alpha n=1 Tax=Neoarius graeffei TaxID=443677 RepID=UPI00298D20B2|nr:deoxyribonuclease-2-alpha [Neoarius graeffei]
MFVFLLLFVLQPAEGANTTISCFNDQGHAVDWFYIYKLPHPHHQPLEEGLKYLLLEKQSEGWTEGGSLVGDITGALGRSLGPLYKNGELGYILYNDQPPQNQPHVDDANRKSGHTKGVVLFDSRQGFWLVHSTPNFPPPKTEGKFSYPSSGINNGQNFICVTYPLERFDTIGEQLTINQPHVYDCDIPKSLASSVPSMVKLCKHQHGWKNSSVTDGSFSSRNRSVSLLSLAGTEFISFAKGAAFGNDLYHAWVAPTLQTDLLVQFWRRSTGVLPSDCSPSWKVLGVHLLSPGGQITFKATEDHSKWAASAGGGGLRGGSWVCVGDINRNEAEEKRGGGTVCRQDVAVWKAYRAAALQCDSCKGKVEECETARFYH